MRLEQKERVVERLTEHMREAPAMIVTDYRGLTVTQVAEVRRSLREAGATFHVAKNTLARLAAKQADRPDLIALLEGPTAIAFVADDPAAAAKKLSEIARQTRILEVRGGVMEGQTLSAADVRALGDLPPEGRAPGPGGRRHRQPGAGGLQRARSTAAGVPGRHRPVHPEATGGRGRLDSRRATCL